MQLCFEWDGGFVGPHNTNEAPAGNGVTLRNTQKRSNEAVMGI